MTVKPQDNPNFSLYQQATPFIDCNLFICKTGREIVSFKNYWTILLFLKDEPFPASLSLFLSFLL